MEDKQKERTIGACRSLLNAYKTGKLGEIVMPEDSSPSFTEEQAEERLVYFTLPMALNYQRNSYKLWEGTLKTWNDPVTRDVFSVHCSASLPTEVLREHLLRYKVALQPNKHVMTWQTLARTINDNWGSVSLLLDDADRDYLKLRDIIQGTHKKIFPYLSGPKIFNYWSYILGEYGGVSLAHREFIEIAPDTHVIKGSVRLEVIDPKEVATLSREEISQRWRTLLEGSGIAPIDLHSPLWFWSRSNFAFEPLSNINKQ